jgi:hypothetical protein
MKSYWDYSEKERAALSHDQVSDLLKFELMDKGVLKPESPELLDEELPEIRKTQFFRVTHAGRYSREPFDIAFATVENAQAFMALKPMRILSEWQYPGDFVKPSGELQIEVVELPTEQDHVAHRPRLAECKANKERNDKAKDEYNKAIKAVDDACDGIWEDFRDMQASDRSHRKVLEVWDQYVADCNGEEEIAFRFLQKAFVEDRIAEAFEWCERELPSVNEPQPA